MNLANSSRLSDQNMWAKITKDNTYVDGSMPEMKIGIQKRAIGEESFMIPTWSYSAISSIGNVSDLFKDLDPDHGSKDLNPDPFFRGDLKRMLIQILFWR